MKQLARIIFFSVIAMTDHLSHFLKRKLLLSLITRPILFTIWGLFLFDVIEWSPYLEKIITTYIYAGVIVSLEISNCTENRT